MINGVQGKKANQSFRSSHNRDHTQTRTHTDNTSDLQTDLAVNTKEEDFKAQLSTPNILVSIVFSHTELECSKVSRMANCLARLLPFSCMIILIFKRVLHKKPYSLFKVADHDYPQFLYKCRETLLKSQEKKRQ